MPNWVLSYRSKKSQKPTKYAYMMRMCFTLRFSLSNCALIVGLKFSFVLLIFFVIPLSLSLYTHCFYVMVRETQKCISFIILLISLDDDVSQIPKKKKDFKILPLKMGRSRNLIFERNDLWRWLMKWKWYDDVRTFAFGFTQNVTYQYR